LDASDIYQFSSYVVSLGFGSRGGRILPLAGVHRSDCVSPPPMPIVIHRTSKTELVRTGIGDSHWRSVYPGGLGVLAFVRLSTMVRAWGRKPIEGSPLHATMREWRPWPHEVRVSIRMDGLVLSDEIFGDIQPFDVFVQEVEPKL